MIPLYLKPVHGSVNQRNHGDSNSKVEAEWIIKRPIHGWWFLDIFGGYPLVN